MRNVLCMIAMFMGGATAMAQEAQQPAVVTATEGAAPSDAVVLFDGTNADAWSGGDKWKIEDGALVVAPKGGDIRTKQGFGDVQLHVEWATPKEVSGNGQGRGNSGVFLMDRYEVQVLDSYQNETYPDGSAGAIYKASAPLVNVSRPPGEWQTYDIVFRAPRFNADGSVAKPATITVLHNGVLIQDHHVLKGTTFHDRPHAYEKHADKLPIRLQDHGNPVRFRNIWVRELPPQAE